MTNLTGEWAGLITGTNRGKISFSIVQDGELVTGSGTINDTDVGAYRYTVAGRTSPSIQFQMLPAGRQPQFNLGRVVVNAELDGDNQLTGTWASDLGTRGTFRAARAARRGSAVVENLRMSRDESVDEPLLRSLRRGTRIDGYELVV